MKKLGLAGFAALSAGAALLAVPHAAQAQYVGVAPAYGYGPVYGAPAYAPPRAGYYGAPAFGPPNSAFPYAMDHEIRYINGAICRTIYEPGVGRIPVACTR